MENQKIKICQKGERVLKQKAKEVPVAEIKSKKFQSIIKKMEKVILENDEALAVAAPQIGEGWQIFVISEWALNPGEQKPKTEYKNMVFINPKILKVSKDRKIFDEGCLSAPSIFGKVKRAEKVKVEAYDENGQKFSRGASGIFSQAVQHEIDHLNGVLFTDKTILLHKSK